MWPQAAGQKLAWKGSSGSPGLESEVKTLGGRAAAVFWAYPKEVKAGGDKGLPLPAPKPICSSVWGHILGKICAEST